MNGEKLTPITNKPSLWALSPLLVFLCLYLVTSLIVDDFYKVPITVAFMVSSVYAVCITKGLSLNERMLQYSIGAANKNIMLMIWIFILAGAFAQSAKDIGAIDATVNMTLHLLPDNLLLAGVFLAACFISISIGTSVGTIVALVPVVAGIAEKTDMNLAFMVGIVVGGAFFGDNLSFISDTTIAATRTQGCAMRDKFRVNFMIALPAALIVFGYYIFRGMDIMTTPEVHSVEWVKVIPYLVVLGTAIIMRKCHDSIHSFAVGFASQCLCQLVDYAINASHSWDNPYLIADAHFSVLTAVSFKSQILFGNVQ